MSKPIFNVFLAVGENCESEAYALRATLEYFGIQVSTRWIGRPNDLIDIISGNENLSHFDYLILSFHGDEQRFCLPKLGADIYTKNEPKSKFFSAKEIHKFGALNRMKIISSGCTLGAEPLAQAMLHAGAKLYIAPNDYIDGNASLMFLTHFFYQLTLGCSSQVAFNKASSINKETQLYRFYKAKKSSRDHENT
ncbi:hypothetical protein [Acinetobacter rudis]|uniref:Delta-aminolevulinic acid dehydratase n=1 Tax=Acinetobacter rudis CIP 110305 TaxID=421052 RepID=S3N5U7_9GAMM|nr:hypothetical protein [Acinetobacter rudis]EPF73843.1 hypothetical protein F945_01722 [Acinetobacter rudis CIP 110305]